jgi:hypothetical protein
MINHWMFKCKDISHLISRSMDQKLPLRIRLGIKFHLMMCNLCLRYKKQLELIHKAISKIETENENSYPSVHLPDQIKKTIKKKLKQE